MTIVPQAVRVSIFVPGAFDRMPKLIRVSIGVFTALVTDAAGITANAANV